MGGEFPARGIGCHPEILPERLNHHAMSKPIPYFEADGSYNEREPRRTKPRIDDSFRLDFETSIALQVSLKMHEHHQREIVRCVEASRVLFNAGCLPGNRYRQMQRQINLKADRYVRKFKKDNTPDPEFAALFKDTCNTLTNVQLISIETGFRKAIFKAEGGVLPDEAALREMGQVVIDRDGVYHLLWKAPKTVIGEKPDMSKCIASVCPRRIFNFSRTTP